MGGGRKFSFRSAMAPQFNEGVVASIKQNPYSIGYLQTTYAIDNQITFGLVENASRSFRQGKRRSALPPPPQQ